MSRWKVKQSFAEGDNGGIQIPYWKKFHRKNIFRQFFQLESRLEENHNEDDFTGEGNWWKCGSLH